MPNVKPNFFYVLLIYSLLASCANSAYADNIFSKAEIKKFQSGDLNKLILNGNETLLSNLELIDLDDNVINITLNDGKLRVLNFWALWCAPCRREMGTLNELKANVKGDDFEVIAVAAGRNSVSKISDFFTEGKLSQLRNLRDPTGKISNSFGVVGLPTTILISPMGFEIGRVIGDINWSSKESIKLFTSLIEKY